MSLYPKSFLYIFIFSFIIYKYNSLNHYNNIFIPFKTKKLRIDYEEEIVENLYYPEENTSLNPTSFLNKWFYNDIHFNIKIGNPSQELKTFINFDNSNFSIGKCITNTKSFSNPVTKDKFISSKTLTFRNNNNNKIGNDYAFFYDVPNYFSNIYVNELYKGIDFIYEDFNDDGNLCGYIGLKMNDNNIEKTNFVEQLKHKGVIGKYVWTIDYITLSQGVVAFGSEPHFYDSQRYDYSQYKTIYTNLKNNQKNWSFNFDKININGTNNILLKDTNCELLIDHGLIIGTEEYQKFIEQNYFNELIEKEICFKEISKLNKTLDEYIIFYCDKLKFKGESFNSNKSEPFYKFNDINLYQKGFEYIFKMTKEILFEDIEDKVYFLIIFNKNGNNIWKLGEPFISDYKFVFNQEQKTIGFYNRLIEKVDNSENNFDNIENNVNKKNNYINHKSYTIQSIIKIMTNIMLILVSIFVILYIIKKILAKRKLRANELLDNYQYLANKNNKIIDNSFDSK